MKKLMAIVLALAMLATIGGTAFADTVTPPPTTGNGSYSGYHFTLNILGVDNPKTADMTYPVDDPSGRSSIFVLLSGRTKIYLQDGGEFESTAEFKDAFGVIDANGTDGSATIQIPNPMYDPYVIGYTDMETVDHIADYTIFVRPLGKPGPENYATITTCAELINESSLFGMLPASDQKEIKNAEREAAADGDTVYASVEQVGQDITLREKGKSLFTNVTAELTSIVFQVDLINIVDDEEVVIATYFVRVPIFDEMLDGEYWEYDNHNLKHLQVRFYPVECDVTYADEPWQPIIPE